MLCGKYVDQRRRRLRTRGSGYEILRGGRIMKYMGSGKLQAFLIFTFAGPLLPGHTDKSLPACAADNYRVHGGGGIGEYRVAAVPRTSALVGTSMSLPKHNFGSWRDWL